jgi:tetraacyldisaccharide 4'-kinase
MIILDDGMQHRRIARDLEVAVVNALDVFGQGYYLPRGFLRENVNALSRADLVIVNHIKNEQHLSDIKQLLLPHTKAPMVGTCVEISQICLKNGKMLNSIADKRVGIFCGIAHPAHFFNSVNALGANIVDKHYLGDHDAISPNALHDFIERCRQKEAELVLCTEKDIVKVNEFMETALPVGWLQMKLKIVSGSENWQAFIKKARKDLSRRI